MKVQQLQDRISNVVGGVKEVKTGEREGAIARSSGGKMQQSCNLYDLVNKRKLQVIIDNKNPVSNAILLGFEKLLDDGLVATYSTYLQIGMQQHLAG